MAELTTRSFKAGEVIFRFGDSADCAYVVESGEISITSSFEGHGEFIAVLHKGELLGEMGIIDNASRSATAIARTNCKLNIIDKEQFHSRLGRSDPVIQLIITVLLERMRSLLHPQKHASASSRQYGTGFDNIQLENQLKASLGTDELRLFLQPIADIKTQSISGFEALIRWKHPDKGFISPDKFIKIAEDSGVIIKVGRWILHEACRMAQWLETHPNSKHVEHTGSFISINVSTPQFNDPSFFIHLKESIEETGINPSRIKLEITESVLTDAEAAKHWIMKAKMLGVKIALDDFGTGYSSLSYLHEFDFDSIKIDQSFIRKMLSNERSMHIVEAIITLAEKLNLEIIAEGIESEQHIEALKKMGCHLIQGYVISKPIPFEDLENV